MEAEFEKPRSRLLTLLRTHAYKKGEFILASGRRSNFFIDCKAVILTAEGHYLCAKVFSEALRPFFPLDGVAAVVAGGCPLASGVSTLSWQQGVAPLGALYIRKERKDHGTGRLLDGLAGLPAGGRVALLEDVLTSGGSLHFAAEQVRGAGLVLAAAIVLVDREEGGAEALADLKVPIMAIFRKGDFLQ